MKKALALILAACCVLSLVACSAPAEEPAQEPAEQATEATEPETAAEPRELQRLTLGAAGSGGTFYIWGAGLSSVINSKYPEAYDVSVMASGGPAQNCELLHQGECQLGFVTSFVAYDYYNGTGIATAECPELRTLFPMYNSYFHLFALADSDVNGISDINGKALATGTPGSSSQIVGDAIIELFGLTPTSTSPISLSQVMDNLKDGQVDVGMAVSAYPVSSLVELQATHDFKLIPISDDELAKLKEYNSGYGDGVIPAGTYNGQDADYNTLSFWTLCLATSEMDEQTAYELTKYTFENLEDLGAAVGNVSEVVAENVLGSPIPIHPGAARYYKEIGVNVPDELIG